MIDLVYVGKSNYIMLTMKMNVGTTKRVFRHWFFFDQKTGKRVFDFNNHYHARKSGDAEPIRFLGILVKEKVQVTASDSEAEYSEFEDSEAEVSDNEDT